MRLAALLPPRRLRRRPARRGIPAWTRGAEPAIAWLRADPVFAGAAGEGRPSRS